MTPRLFMRLLTQHWHSWLTHRRQVPRLPKSQDLRRTPRRSALLFQFDAGSGFGDRVGYYLGACALAKCWEMDVYARWVHPEAHDMGRAPLELVRFPARLHFDQSIPYPELDDCITLPNFRDLRFNSRRWRAGYDLVPELQYAMWSSWSDNFRNEITREQYLASWREEALELQPTFDIQLPPQPYLALHLRRGDKSHANVSAVEDETRRILAECICEHRTWAVFSDSPTTTAAFQDVVESKGGEVLRVPDSFSKQATMIAEFFWIRHALGVVQSVGQSGQYGGFSSFSYLPAMISQIPLITCIPSESTGDTRFQDYARANGGRLENVFYNREVSRFLERVRAA